MTSSAAPFAWNAANLSGRTEANATMAWQRVRGTDAPPSCSTSDDVPGRNELQIQPATTDAKLVSVLWHRVPRNARSAWNLLDFLADLVDRHLVHLVDDGVRQLRGETRTTSGSEGGAHTPARRRDNVHTVPPQCIVAQERCRTATTPGSHGQRCDPSTPWLGHPCASDPSAEPCSPC
jgi:hypothetical protein